MKLGHGFEPGLKLLEFEKMHQSQNQNCTVLNGRTGLKIAPKEPPIFFKESKLNSWFS
jgi:hypothetical protein